MRSLTRLLSATIARTRFWPTWARYGTTIGIVLIALMLRWSLGGVLGERYPFLLFYVAILVSAGLFDHGAGLLATALGAIAAGWSPAVAGSGDSGEHLLAVLLFIVLGVVVSLMVEAMHRALADAQHAHAEAARSENRRQLLLQEFHHRMRNDLQSLSALLLLRARGAASSAAADGLREAAEHARALSRVHRRLAPESPGYEDDPARVNTHDLVRGLCHDLEVTQAAGGLRPVALDASAEAHMIEAERAVHLGLVLNELVTNALKYAFPDERPGTVRIRFARDGEEFVLVVTDDGVGVGDHLAEHASDRTAAAGNGGGGLGTRILQALAAQLRGTIVRRPADGAGTEVELRFPAAAPGSATPTPG